MVVFDNHEFLTAEEKRLQEDRHRTKYWKKWGSYLAERQWATGSSHAAMMGLRTSWAHEDDEARANTVSLQCEKITVMTVTLGAVSSIASQPPPPRGSSTSTILEPGVPGS